MLLGTVRYQIIATIQPENGRSIGLYRAVNATDFKFLLIILISDD